MTVRSGIGFDSHRLEEGRRLVLGGVLVPSRRGLAGHSDADVLAHAVADALLGAAGLGDIGVHFPDTEERWRDADSIELLRAVRALLDEQRLAPVNVDTVVMCEDPKLGPFRKAMRERLAAALGLAAADVSVKFTTGEGMGFVGRGEGIAALATVSVAAASAPPA
jgi:2-C-methyl-D-erythritol 2,4-cyclodiphosphate synthase